MNIPCKNKEGEIINYTIVSIEDYEQVSKYKWHFQKNTYKLCKKFCK